MDAEKQEVIKRQSAHDYVYCPECGTKVMHDSGCVTCPSCGWSSYKGGEEVGRPKGSTKLTKDIQDKIVSAIRLGNYMETAAAYAGISKDTLYAWLKRGQREKEKKEKDPSYEIPKYERQFVRFSDAVEKALAEAEMRDVMIIYEASKEQWQAAAWRLERKFPDRWGRKLSVEGKQELIIPRVEIVYENTDTED